MFSVCERLTFLHAYIDVCVRSCGCTSVLASRARDRQWGIALSVHLSSLERSHSATPAAVRALCPPQFAALPPSLPLSPPSPLLRNSPSHFSSSSSSQLPPQLCLLAAVPLLRACPVYLAEPEQQSHPTRLTHKMLTNTVCMPTHSSGYTLKMKLAQPRPVPCIMKGLSVFLFACALNHV